MKFSCFEGLSVEMSLTKSSSRECDSSCAGPALDLCLIGLAAGLCLAGAGVRSCIGRVLAALLGAVGFVDLVETSRLGLSAGLLEGVSGFSILLDAYGSAVAGLVSSGLRGRRTGADMSEPAPTVAEVCRAGRVAEEDIAEGGRAGCEGPAVGATRPFREVEEGCRVGEKLDCAELGRSGIPLAAN